MQFIRGQKPSEAMNVGQTAVAPVIAILYQLDPTNMVEGPDGKIGPAHNNVSSVDNIHKVLKSIQDKTNDVRTRFYSFSTDKDGYQGRISKFKGEYIKFETVLYHIPKDAV